MVRGLGERPEPQGRARGRLRAGHLDRREVTVVEPRLGEGPGLVERTSQPASVAEQASRVVARQRVEAEVHAIGVAGERDVDASVHDQLRGVAAARASRHRIVPGEQRGALELSIPRLHPVDAGRDAGRDGRFDVAVRQQCPVEDEAQDRVRVGGQNEATPSRGLDAVAYRRRGIRPDS